MFLSQFPTQVFVCCAWKCVSFSHLLLDEDEWVAYLNCSLVVWAVEQGDFDGDGLGPVLGGLLGGFGGFAGGLLGAVVFPVILWNLAERKSLLWVSEPQIALLCLPLYASELWFSGRHYVFCGVIWSQSVWSCEAIIKLRDVVEAAALRC